MMAKVQIYSTGTCPICDKTKAVLNKWGIEYDALRVDTSQEHLKAMLEKTDHARTVPQIIIEDKWIGGFSQHS